MEVECKSQEITRNDKDELLGSVTQQTDTEGGVQLRSSARVSKKLLDSLAQATQSSTDKKEIIREEEKKVETPICTEGKPRAKRVDWSPEDKFAFFEALNEFGKDIDAIHNYLVLKAKRRGNGQEMKSKDQVRFFYYRMWSILSKHINFPSYIKKQTQELYALINFGELRKKFSLSNKKHYEKLSEMIYSGSTQLKFRGKVRKVRTPLCKALRKLNQIEESSEELRLPSSVTIELRPRSNEDWCRVQGLAQNPRVRSVLPLHRRLESLMTYLQQRWQTDDLKLREQLGGSQVDEWVLHVGPKAGIQASEPTVKLSEVATSSKLSLTAYEARFHPGASEVHSLLHQLPVIHRNKGRGVKRPRADSLNAKDTDEGVMEVAGGGEPMSLGPDIIETAAAQLLTLNCFTDNAQPEALSPHIKGESTELSANINVDNGWTLATSGSIRVGDIYMMFGCEGKVHLDYWWEPPEAKTCNLADTLQKLISVAKVELLKSKPSTSNNLRPESKIHSSKSRASKPKPLQDNSLKDTQLKLQVGPLPLDAVFRRPLIATLTSEGSSLHLDKMKPKYCNRRGRTRRLPPTQRPISLFSAIASQADFKPIVPISSTIDTPISIGVKVTPVENDAKNKEVNEKQVPSPPSLSNLLDDLSLPSIRSSRLSTPVPSFQDLLGSSDVNPNSRDQWISSEVTDMSLSGFSFLNNIDTDIQTVSDNTQLSNVDSQLRSFMNTDNSSDINNIIADLTSNINPQTN